MRTFRIVLCAAVLVAALTAMAQTSPGDVVVDVPFAFVVARQTLPAGRYIVKRVDENVVRISNSKTSGLYVPTHAAVRSGNGGSRVVFHRYGDRYFLSAVWVNADQTGRELFPSQAERELAQGQSDVELAVLRAVK